MEKKIVSRKALPLVGLAARTRYQDEITPGMGKIGPTLSRYIQEGVADKIPNRATPGVTYCVYTDYESDEKGFYTYFVGEEVKEMGSLESPLECITIPSQTYVKMTAGPGIMPAVCIQAWQSIWAMDSVSLGGTRRYVADFEVYDHRALDPLNTYLDIYVGIKEG